MPWTWLLLCCGWQAEVGTPLTRAIGEVLARAATPDHALVAPLARELVALGEIEELLLAILVEGRVPDGDEGSGLSRIQERIVLEALREDRRLVSAFLEDVRQHPEPVERVAVALRLLGLTGRTSDLDDMRVLLQTVQPQDCARVEEAFEQGLLDWLARDREVFDALPTFCGELSPEHASVVVRALAKSDSPDAPRCLRKLLDHPDALQACVLQALATTADLVPREEALDLAEELLSHLDCGDALRAVAAANALGRLRVASSIPALIELLASDEPAVARASLAALRSISGTSLAASSDAWRRWYAAEETWWRERAPDLVRVLEGGARDEPGRARLAAALGELSEHTLYRDELAPIAAAGLECRDPGLRVLTCAALERLGSRAALPFLCALLEDANEAVAVHAHRVLRTLARVDLPRERERWEAYLRENGFALDDAPVRSPP